RTCLIALSAPWVLRTCLVASSLPLWRTCPTASSAPWLAEAKVGISAAAPPVNTPATATAAASDFIFLLMVIVICLGPSNLWSLSASAVKQQSHPERVGCPLAVGSTTKVWPVPGIVRHTRGPWSSGGAQSATSTRRPAMG